LNCETFLHPSEKTCHSERSEESAFSSFFDADARVARRLNKRSAPLVRLL
jgi:hypothetical protein